MEAGGEEGEWTPLVRQVSTMATVYYSTLQPLTVVTETGKLTYPFGPIRLDWTPPKQLPSDNVVHHDKIVWPAVVSHDQSWRSASHGENPAGLRADTVDTAVQALAGIDGSTAAALAAHGVDLDISNPLNKLRDLQSTVAQAKLDQEKDKADVEARRKQAEAEAAAFARSQIQAPAKSKGSKQVHPSMAAAPRPGPTLAPVDHSYGTEEARIHAEASTEATQDRLKDLSFDFDFN